MGMIEFSVKLANRPGQLATLSRDLANAGVNIEALAAFTSGPEGFVKLVVDEDISARRVLVDSGMSFEERRIISAVIHDEPGALAEMTEALANTGVNIEAMYLLHSGPDGLHFGVAVDDRPVTQKIA